MDGELGLGGREQPQGVPSFHRCCRGRCYFVLVLCGLKRQVPGMLDVAVPLLNPMQLPTCCLCLFRLASARSAAWNATCRWAGSMQVGITCTM